jgi:ElaB/YqjD/DUF883 family membrane-anchored ribosome-binding protein
MEKSETGRGAQVPNASHPQGDSSPTGMERVSAARQGLTDAVQDVVSTATDTMDAVKKTMGETVDTVKDATRNAVDTVKSALDVRQHPWLLLAGALALGFLIGGLVPSHRNPIDP